MILDQNGIAVLSKLYPTGERLETAPHSQDGGEEPGPIAPPLSPLDAGPPPPPMNVYEAAQRLHDLTGFPRQTFLYSTPDNLAHIFGKWNIPSHEPAAHVLLNHALTRHDPRQSRPL